MTRTRGRITVRCTRCGRTVEDCDTTRYEQARDIVRRRGWAVYYETGLWKTVCPDCLAGEEQAA